MVRVLLRTRRGKSRLRLRRKCDLRIDGAIYWVGRPGRIGSRVPPGPPDKAWPEEEGRKERKAIRPVNRALE